MEGWMTPTGLTKIVDAKENGEWDATAAREDVSSVPDDLEQELENNDAWMDFVNGPFLRKSSTFIGCRAQKERRPEKNGF